MSLASRPYLVHLLVGSFISRLFQEHLKQSSDLALHKTLLIALAQLACCPHEDTRFIVLHTLLEQLASNQFGANSIKVRGLAFDLLRYIQLRLHYGSLEELFEPVKHQICVFLVLCLLLEQPTLVDHIVGTVWGTDTRHFVQQSLTITLPALVTGCAIENRARHTQILVELGRLQTPELSLPDLIRMHGWCIYASFFFNAAPECNTIDADDRDFVFRCSASARSICSSSSATSTRYTK